MLHRPWVIWGLFACVYAPSALANIRGLAGPPGRADVLARGVSVQSQFEAASAFAVLQVAAAAGAVMLLIFGRALGPVPVGRRRAQLGLRWRDERRLVVGGVGGAAAGYLAIVAGAAITATVVLDAVGVAGRPTVGGSIPNRLLLLGDFLMSIGSGIGEEVLLLAIPFALATRAGWKPWEVIALLTGLRLFIHLYYGAGSFFVLLWIPAAYLLYRATGSILPLIVGHVGYDLLAVTVQRSPGLHTPALTALLTVTVLGAALLAGSTARNFTTQRRRSQLPAE